MSKEVIKYFIKDKCYKTYLSDFDFKDTSDTDWTSYIDCACSFDTQKAAWAIKTYIEEACPDHKSLAIIKSTSKYEEVEGME